MSFPPSGAVVHSMTLSAPARIDGRTVMPSAFAVLRLTTNSNLVGRSTGISAGFSPFRILSMYLALRRNSSLRSAP